MITPNPDFRPNPDRAVYVHGVIDVPLIQRLAPEILSLQSQSREPITVYIDSPGGRVDHMIALLQLLKAPTQDFDKPCNLITVVTRQAASAAADLLSSGDYALAFPDSTVLCHGVRLSEERPLTAERTSFLAQMLRMGNESSAMDLAREIEFRFMFRFITSRGEFNAMRQNNPKLATDLDCFLALISENVTEPAKRVLQIAQRRYGRYAELIESVLNKSKKVAGNKTPAEMEAVQIKAIVDFEVRQNKKDKDWSFQTVGLDHLTDDFFLLNEYLAISQSERFKRLCSRFGRWLLTPDELTEISQGAPEERVQRLTKRVSPLLQPIWSFFVALCHALQLGENDLTATDAFWLGLIDEVIGVQGLESLRMISEYQPDPPAKQIENEEAKAATTTTAEKADAAAGA